METVIPSREAVDGFTFLADPIFLRIAKNVVESRTLAAIRDAVLPKLISGEIRVREAEVLVSERV